MKNINHQLVSELKDLKNSINDDNQLKLIDLVIKIVEGEDNAPPISALSKFLKKLKNKPIVYKVVDLICLFILELGKHEVCIETIEFLKRVLEFIGKK